MIMKKIILDFKNKLKYLFNTISNKKNRLPEKYIIPNEYETPVHDQKDKNNCTSCALAAVFESKLSKFFKERVIIDADDLWEKQKKYGTATEKGDTLEGAARIADEYGVLFETESGKKGIFKPRKGINGIEFLEK